MYFFLTLGERARKKKTHEIDDAGKDETSATTYMEAMKKTGKEERSVDELNFNKILF